MFLLSSSVFMTNKTPSSAKKQVPDQKVAKWPTVLLSFFFFSFSSLDRLVQNCVTLSHFLCKTASFYTEHRWFFTALKYHEALETSHTRTRTDFICDAIFLILRVHTKHLAVKGNHYSNHSEYIH